MRKRKSILNSVGDNKIDRAFDNVSKQIDDIYHRLDQGEEIGDTKIVRLPNGKDTIAIRTKYGWKVDINASFEHVEGPAFLPVKGDDARADRTKAVKGEALKYDSSRNIKLKDTSGTAGITLKNDSGKLLLRNLADSADAEIRAKKFKLSDTSPGTGEFGVAASDSIFLKTNDGSVNYVTVMQSLSGAVQGSVAGTALQFTDNLFKLVDNADTSKGVEFQVDTVTGGATRTLSIPDANGTLALTSGVGVTSLNNATENELVTVGNTTTELDAEANLTYDGNTLSATSTSAAQVKLLYDANNYTTITTAANGATTIATVDEDAGVAGHLTLSPDGDTKISTKTIITSTSVPQLRVNYDVGNYADIEVNSTGDLEICSVGGGTLDSDITLDADGDIHLDSANGVFVAKKAGTEFSATDSAYAGMILGYTKIFNTDAVINDGRIVIGNSFAVIQSVNGTDASITFVAPPSGNVEITFKALVYGSSQEIMFSLSDNASYNELDTQYTYDDISIKTDETDYVFAHIPFTVTGLTAGTSYTHYIGAKATSTAYIYHGADRTGGKNSPPIIIQAVALPATLVTGT